MNGMARLAVFLLLLPPRADGADLRLKPVHPDETVEQTLNERFSVANALGAMGTIQGWLESFRRLTDAARNKITPSAWKGIGNTEWDIQALGFRNLPAAIAGALRYQNYLLKKTRLQLVEMELRAGKASAQQAELARREMERAEREFQAFWDSMSIAD